VMRELARTERGWYTAIKQDVLFAVSLSRLTLLAPSLAVTRELRCSSQVKQPAARIVQIRAVCALTAMILWTFLSVKMPVSLLVLLFLIALASSGFPGVYIGACVRACTRACVCALVCA
jgi:hypothetical protein